MRRNLLGVVLMAGIFSGNGPQAGDDEPWVVQETGTKSRLRGLGAVGRDVAWASGMNGTWLRTIDGGHSWKMGIVPGAEKLDFRDLHAVDGQTAYLLSAGAGELSRIYKTTDGGLRWTCQLTNPDSKGFLDALAFWDPDHGLAFGDPVDGKFVLFATENGGKSWMRMPSDGMPPALEGEGAFAASGTCLVVGKEGRAWFATGGAKVARVFRSVDHGRTWSVHETPIRAGVPSAGIFSLAFRDAENGVIVGGDYKKPDDPAGVCAITSDGGKTWHEPKGRGPSGYRSAAAYLPGMAGKSLIAVGPTGSEISKDAGETWERLGKLGFDSVVIGEGAWASGEGGRVARLR